MDDNEKTAISLKVIQVIQDLQTGGNEWVDFARVGAPLTATGVQYKQFGFSKLRSFLNEFQDMLEFRDEQFEEKPPVCYVRTKSGKQKAGYKTSTYNTTQQSQYISVQSNPKPPVQTGKPILMGLGFVIDLHAAIDFLSQKVGYAVEKDKLEDNLEKSYENGDILYYEYDADGGPINVKAFSNQTAIFAVNSGLCDANGNTLYAQYNKNNQGWSGVFFNSQLQIFNNINAYKIGNISFKNFEDANNFIKNLEADLLPGEKWKYVEPAKNGLRRKTKYEILESYLKTVLTALMHGYNKPDSLNYGKIKFSKDYRYALFNTGLLSRYATDVIVFGEIFPMGKRPSDRFHISNPAVLKGGKTELARMKFNSSDAEVDMVSFFKDVSQIVYDATAEVDVDDIEKLHHCIDEGIKRNRFPQKCKEQYDQGEIEELTDTFTKAIHRSERIARRNYKYVVPQYRITPHENRIQFLMPIYMLSKYDESPDFALVLSENLIGGKKFYKPETVLELAWAYNNARAICKPDDMWLNPATIENSEMPDEDYSF